jgi:hypothetical protein
MGEVFGATQKQNYFPPAPALKWRSSLSVITVPGEHTVETYELGTAEATGFFNGKPAATRNRYGKGTAYLLGINAGGKYDSEKSDALARVLRGICKTAGIKPEAQAGGRCLARVAASGGHRMVFVYNFEDRPVLTSVEVPGKRGRDLLTGEGVSLHRLTMAPKGSRIILLD